MRLLHTKHLRLKEWNVDIPRYAILSHTWEDEEVTFVAIQDFQTAQNLKGFAKLRDAARIAESLGYEWIWIDTCGIDKSSSAELSETINSMFAYYKRADVCIAYLADVVGPQEYQDEQIKASKWFTRGWTLQELIAPRHVQFYNRDWCYLGSKFDLISLITDACYVDAYVLRGGELWRMSLARRMYWAARRRTSRAEDMAYCLLGIFNVHMPLLYGEGLTNAFLRLQREILRVSNDQSLFAWQRTPLSASGLLASNPSAFQFSGSISALRNLKVPLGINMACQTSMGLQIELLKAHNHQMMGVVLECQIGDQPGSYPFIILDYMVEDSFLASCGSSTHFEQVRFADRGQETDSSGFVYGHLHRRQAVLTVPNNGWRLEVQPQLFKVEALQDDFRDDEEQLRIWIPHEEDKSSIEFIDASGKHIFDTATRVLSITGKKTNNKDNALRGLIELLVNLKPYQVYFIWQSPYGFKYHSAPKDTTNHEANRRRTRDYTGFWDPSNYWDHHPTSDWEIKDGIIDIELTTDTQGPLWKMSSNASLRSDIGG